MGLSVLAAAAAPRPLAAEVVNRVVLRINDRIATLHDYEQRRGDLERELLDRQDMPLEQRREMLNNLGTTVFRDLFEELMLLSRADQLDVQVSDADVDARVAQIRENFGLESQADFETALAQQGMRLADFRDQIRKNIRIQGVLAREVQQAIELDDEELRRIYRDNPDRFVTPEQLQLRELVVLEDHGADADERRRLAARLRDELLAGRAIAELSEEHRDSGATSAVIDIGWVKRGDLTPDLEAAVWDLQAGEVTEPVEGRGGLHLIEVVDRRQSELRPFSEVIDEIRARERQRRFATEYARYLDELEAKSFVVLDPPPEAADFRRAAAGEPVPPVGLEAAAEAVAEETVSEEEGEPAPAPEEPFADPDDPEVPPPDQVPPPN